MSNGYNVALYGSGLFGRNLAPLNSTQLTAVQGSGFTTLILWALHVDAAGDFNYNDTPIVVGGNFTNQYSYLPALLTELKASGTVNQILFSLGGWGVGDFDNIKTLFAEPNNAGKATLIKSFNALAAALPIDGFDFDLEPTDHVYTPYADTVVELSLLLAGVAGGVVTYCPYEESDFWLGCVESAYQQNQSQPVVSWFNLQCYAGGGGNDPNQWVTDVSNVASQCGIADPNAFIVPGYDAGSGPAAICQNFPTLKVKGGFIWNSSGVFASGSPPSDYAQAVTNGLQNKC
jgi:hypothetical protein